MASKRSAPDALAEELREITVTLRRLARAEFADEANVGPTLPYAQLSVLKRLEANGPAATADLARAEAMTAQSMGAVVAALEQGGYVSRRDDPNHGRRRLVSTTAAGRKMLATNRTARLRWTANVLAERLDDAERRTLADALALLRRAFLTRGESNAVD